VSQHSPCNLTCPTYAHLLEPTASNTYFFNSLLGSEKVDQAAIFDATGAGVWATSPNFNIKPAEMQAIVQAFKEITDPKLWATGIHVAGQKYLIIKAEDRSIYGKKVRDYSLLETNRDCLDGIPLNH
jgi:profilin